MFWNATQDDSCKENPDSTYLSVLQKPLSSPSTHELCFVKQLSIKAKMLISFKNHTTRCESIKITTPIYSSTLLLRRKTR